MSWLAECCLYRGVSVADVVVAVVGLRYSVGGGVNEVNSNECGWSGRYSHEEGVGGGVNENSREVSLRSLSLGLSLLWL